jgi:hypothetical protein
VSATVQVWVAALVTLGLWTWLYNRQSPIFDFVQSLYIALAFAYGIALQYFNYMQPQLPKIAHGQWGLALAIVMGLLIYARYIKPIEYLSRWSVSYFVGYGAGYVLAFSPAVFLGQVNGGFVRLWGTKTASLAVDNWIYFLCLLAAIVYFFFTVRRENPLYRAGSTFGRYVIMVAMGALFAATILYRYDLLFGRVYFIFHNWLGVV